VPLHPQPVATLDPGRRRAHRPAARRHGAGLRLRSGDRGPARGVRVRRPLPRRGHTPRLARRGDGRDRARRAHGRRHADPRSQARRSGDPRHARLGRLLPRLPRLHPDACEARCAADRGRVHRGGHRPHPCARRPRHRRAVAGRDRGGDPGRDHPRAEARAMRFGPVPPAEAEGAVLAHSLMLGGRKLPKGRVLGADEVAALRAAGVTAVTVARLDPGDVGEDAAAGRLARALVPDPAGARLTLSPPHAGRVNFHATGPGIVEIDTAAVHALNRADPALTFATLAPFARVAEGTMVGTVKVIAYAVAGATLEEACRVAPGAIRVRPVALGSAGLILTTTGAPNDAKLARKGEQAVAARLAALGMTLAEVVEVPHDAAAIAAA